MTFYNLLHHLSILLIVCIIILSVFSKARVPSSVSYITTGIIVGPYLLNILPNVESTRFLAEMGIVLLMFTVGLEFSLNKLLETKRAVFLTGGFQALVTFLTVGTMAFFFKLSLLQAILLGGAVTMSSTAIVVKQLADQNELHTHAGRMIIGILLFQDLATLPFLIILSTSTEVNNQQQSITTLLQTLPINLLALISFYVAGRWLIRPFIYYVANLKSNELFMLTALTTLIITSWLAEQLAISLPISAFVVGMVLGETSLKYQLEEDLRPFRDVLIGIFFISIGTQFNPNIFIYYWPLIMLTAAGIIITKAILSIITGLITKHPLDTCIKASLALAHTGEFGLLILTTAMGRNLFNQTMGQTLLAAIIITICISPFLIHYYNKIANYFLIWSKFHDIGSYKTVPATTGTKNHIIICGFGKIGTYLSEWFMIEKIPFIIIDNDIQRVHLAKNLGYTAIYGDVTRHGILQKADVKHAKAIAVTFNHPDQTYKIARTAKINQPDILVIACAKDIDAVKNLREAGVDVILPEAIEISLMFGRKLFSALGYPSEKIEYSINQLRKYEIKNIETV